MADNIVSGLFGLSPDDVRRQQYAQMQANALAMSQMPPAQQADYYGGMAGGQIGGMLQGAIGIPNKEVEAAKRREAALQGADVQTPDGLRALAAKFQNAGMQQQAMLAAAKANEMDKLAQNELLERQKQALAERKQTFQEQDAFDLKKMQIEAAIRQKDDQLENQRLSAQDRNEILRQSNDLKRMLVDQKLSQPKALSATEQKELFEADDMVQASQNVQTALQQASDLNSKAYSGYFAKSRAFARSNLPGESEQANATVALDNIMTGQALESLKTLFGAMPTEGERKILLEMQASVEKTPVQRKEIINRAMTMAKRREQLSADKAEKLRSGEYRKPGGAPSSKGGVKFLGFE